MQQLSALAAFLVCLCAAGGVLSQPAQSPHELFVTGDNCMACHNGLVSPSGEDVSIGLDWSASMMANSARDPYWQASVRREVIDHPQAAAAIQDECSACHMPMARYSARAGGGVGEVFAHLPFGAAADAAPLSLLAEDGVSCSLCHQITPEDLGEPQSFTAGFHIDPIAPLGKRDLFGPFQIDDGRREIMRSAAGFRPGEGAHMRSAELCGTCHTLITEALGEDGHGIGSLPEQMPYLEWRHSEFRDRQNCQDCHMPVVEQAMPITSVLGQARQGLHRHEFRGGNFFMLAVLERYRDELGVDTPPGLLEASAQATRAHLQSGAAGSLTLENLSLRDGVLEAELRIANATGHKLPTAYPSRRAWIHFTVRDAGGRTIFESGRFRPDGSIEGNDNDADAARFEPHYRLIDSPEQVQIYEGVLAGPGAEVTTGLLTATRYIKDNRLLPRGFDKAAAGSDIAVRGGAAEDSDFTAEADLIRYRAALAGAQGPFRVEAELWYQPVAYRWAENLAPYDAAETRRFVGYYRAMAPESALILSHDEDLVPPSP